MRLLRWISGLLALLGVAASLNVVMLTEDMGARSVLGPLALGLIFALLWLVLRTMGLAESYGRGRAFYSLNSLAATLVFFGICVVAYAFVNHSSRQWDLTREGRRNLAEQTKQVLQSMDKDVNVVGFFTDTDDAIADATREKTLRFLDQCRGYSPRLKIEFVNPEEHPARLADFKLEKERLSPQGTVVIRCGQRQKVLPLSGKTARLEERDFTNALINVIRKSQPKVYFLRGPRRAGSGQRERSEPRDEGLQDASRRRRLPLRRVDALDHGSSHTPGLRHPRRERAEAAVPSPGTHGH